MRENSLVRWIEAYPQPSCQRIPIGIGDDAAFLAWSAEHRNQGLVVTTDLIADGTHFRIDECSPNQIGRKAMAVNLSDVAAMAAKPVAAFVSLLLPSDANEMFVQELMSAAIDLANSFDCVVAGGDTNCWNGPLAVNVMIVGEVTPQGPLLRSEAQPGDVLCVTGELGGSIQGHHFDFVPRIREAIWLRSNFEIHAGMDLSDGLSLDLQRMCAASDCGAEVMLDQLPISNRFAAKDHADSIRRALGDGEDFELLLAIPADEQDRILSHPELDFPLTAIGSITKGNEIVVVDGTSRSPMPSLGYEHR